MGRGRAGRSGQKQRIDVRGPRTPRSGVAANAPRVVQGRRDRCGRARDDASEPMGRAHLRQLSCATEGSAVGPERTPYRPTRDAARRCPFETQTRFPEKRVAAVAAVPPSPPARGGLLRRTASIVPGVAPGTTSCARFGLCRKNVMEVEKTSCGAPAWDVNTPSPAALRRQRDAERGRRGAGTRKNWR